MRDAMQRTKTNGAGKIRDERCQSRTHRRKDERRNAKSHVEAKNEAVLLRYFVNARVQNSSTEPANRRSGSLLASSDKHEKRAAVTEKRKQTSGSQENVFFKPEGINPSLHRIRE